MIIGAFRLPYSSDFTFFPEHVIPASCLSTVDKILTVLFIGTFYDINDWFMPKQVKLCSCSEKISITSCSFSHLSFKDTLYLYFEDTNLIYPCTIFLWSFKLGAEQGKGSDRYGFQKSWLLDAVSSHEIQPPLWFSEESKHLVTPMTWK